VIGILELGLELDWNWDWDRDWDRGWDLDGGGGVGWPCRRVAGWGDVFLWSFLFYVCAFMSLLSVLAHVSGMIRFFGYEVDASFLSFPFLSFPFLRFHFTSFHFTS